MIRLPPVLKPIPDLVVQLTDAQYYNFISHSNSDTTRLKYLEMVAVVTYSIEPRIPRIGTYIS